MPPLIGLNHDSINVWSNYSDRNNLACMVGSNGGGDPTSSNCWLNGSVLPANGQYTVTPQGSAISIAGVNIAAGATATVTLNQSSNYQIIVAGTLTGLSILPVGVVDGMNPAVIAAYKSFSFVRMMQATRANYTTETSWASRIAPTSFSFCGGMPWESVIQWANLSSKDIWINVPVAATDDYINQLAALFASLLNPGLRVYTEFGNEVWNTSGAIGTQTAIAMATSAWLPNGVTNDPWSRLAQYAAFQSHKIGAAFVKAFGVNASQVVPVYASCIGSPYWTQQALAYLQANGGIAPLKLVACAPYVNDAQQAGESTSQVISDMAGTGITTTLAQIQAFATAVAPYGLPIAAYEFGTQNNNPAADANRIAAQWNAGITPTYQKLFAGMSAFAAAGHYMLCSAAGEQVFSAAKSLADVTSPKIAALIAAAGTPIPPVTSAPVIMLQPLSQTVTAGATVTFTAAASGTPAPTCQWQYLSTVPGAAWTNIGINTPSLPITGSATFSGEQFRAVFTNSAGTATTIPATLTVNPVVAPTKVVDHVLVIPVYTDGTTGATTTVK